MSSFRFLILVVPADIHSRKTEIVSHYYTATVLRFTTKNEDVANLDFSF